MTLLLFCSSFSFLAIRFSSSNYGTPTFVVSLSLWVANVLCLSSGIHGGFVFCRHMVVTYRIVGKEDMAV